MMNSVIQTIIKFSPLALFIMLIFINREEKLQVIGFLGLLFLYTTIIVIRILYAKKVWHDEFNDEAYENDPNIKKMQDLINKFDK